MSYFLEFLRALSERVNVPLIASNGAGNPKHMLDAFKIGKTDAILTASIFYYGTHTIKEVKEYLAKIGMPIRL